LLQRVATAKAQSNHYEPGFRAMREPGLFFAQLLRTLRSEMIAFPDSCGRLFVRFNPHNRHDPTRARRLGKLDKRYQLYQQVFD
jgi:hypothetical protein